MAHGPWLAIAVVVALPSTCSNDESREAVPILDQVEWWIDLTMERPQLADQYVGRIDDPAWQALVIRPRYRLELITPPFETYESIVAREYGPDERAADRLWAEGLQAAEIEAEPDAAMRRIGRPAYAEFRIGPPVRTRDARGFTYKAFFEVDDFLVSLGPDRVTGFARALDAAGFVGGFIIDLRPGQVRFQYNNVIVHAPTMAMADCALATGLSYFASDLLHVGRGIDATKPERSLDWHHFLLTGEFDQLPADVQAFTRSRELPATTSCPAF
jgi:hypothetical protein